MMEELKKSKLWVMVGAPGAGKSYWIYNHINFFTGSKDVISRDVIRFNLLEEDDDYFAKEKEVFQSFIRQIKNSLEKNDHTIADATHLNSSSRGKLLRALGQSLKGVEINAIVIDTCLAKCIEQNAQRGGRKLVPESALRSMFSNITMPDFEEGFDNIYIYTKADDTITYRIIKKNNETKE